MKSIENKVACPLYASPFDVRDLHPVFHADFYRRTVSPLWAAPYGGSLHDFLQQGYGHVDGQKIDRYSECDDYAWRY